MARSPFSVEHIQASIDLEIDAAIEAYVKRVAKGIERDLKAGSPVKTGRLRKGWRVTARIYRWRGGGRQQLGTIYVRNRVFYAVPAASRSNLIGKVLERWGATPNGSVYGG